MNWIQYLLDMQEQERLRRLQARMNRFVPTKPTDELVMKQGFVSPFETLLLQYPELYNSWTQDHLRSNPVQKRRNLIDETM